MRETSVAVTGLADEHGLERVRMAADHFLFLSGLDRGVGSDVAGADEALGFAEELAAALHAIGEREATPIGVHVGVATGSVATGMLRRGNLTFTAWGEPVRRALAIGSLHPEGVVVDTTTADRATPGRHELTPIGGGDEDGDRARVFLLAPASLPSS